ncbi:MAG TPA: hypothetical protein VM938_10210 [Acidimicrobiales bacterium]|nr:hypothetical protein [Acidimicrobiales bacterium]
MSASRPARTTPMADSRRPPEPIRPLPAKHTGITLLAARARRRRYRRSDLR